MRDGTLHPVFEELMPLAFAAVSRQRIAAGIRPDQGETASDGEVCMMLLAAEKKKGVVWPAGGCTIPPELELTPEEEMPMPDETGFEIKNPGGDETRPITEGERRELADKLAAAKEDAKAAFVRGDEGFPPIPPAEIAVKDVVMAGGRMSADERKTWPHLAILEDTMLEAKANRAKAEMAQAKGTGAQYHGGPTVRVGPITSSNAAAKVSHALSLGEQLAEADRAAVILAGFVGTESRLAYLSQEKQARLAVRLARMIREEVAK